MLRKGLNIFNSSNHMIQETTFKPTQYLALKKSIPISQITDKTMYDEAGKKLGSYLAEHNIQPAGPWSVLYFTWDEASKKTDIGIAFPVNNLAQVDDPELSLVDIAGSKAAMDTLYGSYEGLGALHHSLVEYCTKMNYPLIGQPVMAIEEYAVDPMQESSPQKWITHVYYLHP